MIHLSTFYSPFIPDLNDFLELLSYEQLSSINSIQDKDKKHILKFIANGQSKYNLWEGVYYLFSNISKDDEKKELFTDVLKDFLSNTLCNKNYKSADTSDLIQYLFVELFNFYLPELEDDFSEAKERLEEKLCSDNYWSLDNNVRRKLQNEIHSEYGVNENNFHP